jgi:hypothetical protein
MFALLTVLATAVYALPLYSLRAVSLTVYEETYVRLLVGNPGQLINFRLNYSLDEIQLHSSLSAQSQTYSSSEWGGTELFYLGDYRVRLPFRYAADAAEHIAMLSRPGPYGGTLGLGRYSPLWKYWRRVTYAPDSIRLGNYNSYAQLDPQQRPPLLTHGRVSCSLDTGRPAELQLSPKYMDMYLPGEIYTEQPKAIHYSSESDCEQDYAALGIAGSCSRDTTLPVRQQHIYLINQQQYNAVQRSHDGRLHLGQRFLQQFAWFCDWDHDKVGISSSAYGYELSSLNALCAILLILVVTVWLTMMIGQPEEEWLFQMVLFFELYGHLVAGVTVFVNFYAMQWTRFVTNFIEGSATPLLVFYSYVVLVSFSATLGLLLSNVRLPLTLSESQDRHSQNMQRLRRHNGLRVFLFLSSTLTALWLCVLPNHKNGSDLIYLLFFSTALCIAAGVITLHNLWRGRRFSALMAVHTGLFYLFLIYANILPSAHIIDLHDSNFLTIVLYLFALVLFPTEYIFGKLVLFTLRQELPEKPNTT